MIALPLTGWLTASASPLRFPLEYFGMFQLPFLPVEQSRSATGLWSEAHEILAFTTIAVLGLHIAGALKTQFFDRDYVLARMLPQVRRSEERRVGKGFVSKCRSRWARSH